MKNILVIDDSDDVRALVVTVLQDFGFSVRQATSGNQAIEMITAEKPDLIISDVRMPGMDGHQLLSAIRETQTTAPIPFILMTGSGSRDDFRRGMVSGADDYIEKPFTVDELIEAVLSRLVRQTDMQMAAYQSANSLREAAWVPASNETDSKPLFELFTNARKFVFA
ncbi:MAG TPA: response regulator [Verrucomicrobiae bacterium]|jgi:CheY-like chemotaxis protein